MRGSRALLLAALVGVTATSGCRELGFTSRVLWRLAAPDGKSFAVCQEIPGFDGPGFDIRLEEAHGAVVRRLYQIGDGDPCTEMAWSPDGQALAVLSGHVARVRVVDVARVRQRPPEDTTRHFWPEFDFSTEGELRLGKDLRFVGPREIELTTCAYDLRETQRSRGKVRRCTSPEVHQRLSAPAPSSADAAPIAFASHRDGNWEIYVMEAAGQSRRLTRRDVQDRFPIWSPDGAQIAFGSQVGGEGLGWELWVMDATGGRQRRLYSKIVAKSARGWCRDNKRIAFAATATDGNVDIYTVDVESTAVTRLSSSPGEDREPSWSPDCQHLAFSSMRDGNAEIYVVRADGGDPRRLTNNAASDASPVWSPDGSAIAFVSERGEAKDLYVIRPDGQGLQRLTTGAGVTRDSSRWSPDGSRIAFQIARGENYDIGVVRLSDRAHMDFARSDAYDGMYVWSPDGMHIAFVSGRDGSEGLYRADADGRNVQRLTDTPALNPAWARGR